MSMKATNPQYTNRYGFWFPSSWLGKVMPNIGDYSLRKTVSDFVKIHLKESVAEKYLERLMEVCRPIFDFEFLYGVSGLVKDRETIGNKDRQGGKKRTT